MPALRDALSLVLLVAITLGSPVAAVQAQSIYKCVDNEGHIAFQDVACKSGVSEQQVTIASAPTPAPSPEYTPPDRRDPPSQRRTKGPAREAVVYSYECATQSGSLFYRHSRCPASIDRSGLIGGRRNAARENVRARRIPRLDACRGMRSVGRDGREFDDVPSTYDRNLGRDPCRRY